MENEINFILMLEAWVECFFDGEDESEKQRNEQQILL